MHLALAGGRLWRKLTSICEHKRAPVEHNYPLFFKGDRQRMPEAWPRDVASRSHSQGTMVTYVTWDVPFRRELLTLRPLGDAMGNAMPTPPCWGKVPKSWIPKSRLEEHHPCSAELGSKKTLLQASSKARHHRLAHESMALEWKVSESDSLNWEETSTLDAMNS